LHAVIYFSSYVRHGLMKNLKIVVYLFISASISKNTKTMIIKVILVQLKNITKSSIKM